MVRRSITCFMSRCVAVVLITHLMVFATAEAQRPRNVLGADPRELAIDIFTNLKRGTDAEAIAARLTLLIPVFRFSCPRVTDYQVFRAMNNLYDIKVKCSGMPFYGVTVAANGYVSVYGGNGMIQPFDSREGLVFSFGVQGAVIDTSAKSAEDAIDNAVAQLRQGDFLVNTTYLAFSLIALFVILGGSAFIWVRALGQRTRLHRKKPGLKVKEPLARVEIAAGVSMNSDMKNQLQGESEIVARHVYRHPAGFYIARGGKGRRRLFRTLFGAKLYAQFNVKIAELDARAVDKSLTKWVDAPAESGT